MGATVAIQSAQPGRLAGSVVFLRPLALQQCLGPAITHLLSPVGPHGISAVVPDHRPGMKPNLVAGLLQSPTNIHIVAGDAEFRIEATDPFEYRLTKGHVTAGN